MKTVFLAFTLLLLLASAAQAATRVEVVATWPTGSELQLGANQHYYVQLHYTSDKPVHIWLRPYFEGEAANAGSHPSRVYPAGEGEALGWFFLSNDSVQVDEIRIRAGDGSPRGTQEVASYPVRITGGGGMTDAAKPDWATRLLALDQQAQEEAYQKRMNTPITPVEDALISGFIMAVLGLAVLGLGWPIWAWRRWQGNWRRLAAVPAVVMGLVVLNIIIGGVIDPTSHNLWPFEIVMWGGVSCVWMLAISLLRRWRQST